MVLHSIGKIVLFFWQVDNNSNIRGGKVIQYDCNTGSRVKKPHNRINWMHKVLNLKKFTLNQCLFGLHLINETSSLKYVCIVESEKTAIAMSIFLPNYIWMATGSKSAFKETLLQPIKNKQIIACPDKSVYEDWSLKAEKLNKNGCSIIVNPIMENSESSDGDDFVDILL